MTDKVTQAVRSKMMSAVRSKNTKPELTIRKTLFAAGYRFRIHQKKLPGCPDIVLNRYKVAVFVHGCFWHGHSCPRGKRPTSNTHFWNTKIDGNIARDKKAQKKLRHQGWKVITIWDCSLEKGSGRLLRTLAAS